MHPRTRLVYFYFLRVELLLKTWSQGRRHIVRLPWQRYICRSKYGCFCISPKVTYLHTKIEEGLNFFISNFASLSWRIALKVYNKTDIWILFFPVYSRTMTFCVCARELEAKLTTTGLGIMKIRLASHLQLFFFIASFFVLINWVWPKHQEYTE